MTEGPRPAATGLAGESLVADWLTAQGWQVVARRWRCPWGELDLVVLQPNLISFVEVKTRRSGNWDQGGLAALTDRKQTHLRQAAAAFLAAHPHWSDWPCRFDVALVRRSAGRLHLDVYLEAAFT